MNPLKITHDDTPAGPVVHVAGDLDYEHAPALRAYIEGLGLDGARLLTLNLTALAFCDSSGITALLAARRLAQDAATDLVLAAVPPSTLRLFTIVGLHQVFTII